MAVVVLCSALRTGLLGQLAPIVSVVDLEGFDEFPRAVFELDVVPLRPPRNLQAGAGDDHESTVQMVIDEGPSGEEFDQVVGIEVRARQAGGDVGVVFLGTRPVALEFGRGDGVAFEVLVGGA